MLLYLETGGHPVCHSLWSKILCRGDLKNVKQQIMPKPERQTIGVGAEWLQLATYPQSPFSGPACCCDVAYLSQAFSQPGRPGAIMYKSGHQFVVRSDRGNESVIN
jgi:hypothetical protein